MYSKTLPHSKEFLFVIDFTWDGNHLFLLEMGDYFQSGVTVLDHIRKKENKGPLYDEILHSIKTKYKDALFLEDNDCFTKSITLHDLANNNQASYNLKYNSVLTPLFEIRANFPDTTPPLRNLIAAFSKKLSPDSTYSTIKLESALKASKNFRVLNFLSGGLHYSCINKVSFYLFSESSHVIPATCLVDLYTLDEKHIQNFLEKNNQEFFIIKPISQSRGTGVEVISRGEVPEFLKKLYDYRSQQLNHAEISDTESYWYYQIDKFLLLQTCCPSKEIEDGYRPTGRAVIRALFNNNDNDFPEMEYLGYFWKRPVSSSPETNTKSIVSNSYGSAEKEADFVSIDDQDWEAIKSQMDEKLPSIIGKMFQTSTQEMISQFQKHDNPLMQSYGNYLYVDMNSKTLQRHQALNEILDELASCLSTTKSELNRYDSKLDRGSDGSTNHATYCHFISALIGLYEDSKDYTKDALEQALYRQFGLELPKKNIVCESIINSDLSQQSSLVNNNNQLFHRKKVIEETISEEKDVKQASRCRFACNIF